MSASSEDPRVKEVAQLLADIDSWRLKNWEEKSLGAYDLAARVIKFMENSGLDAPLEFRVNSAMNSGLEERLFKLGSAELDAAALRARAMVLEMFAPLAIKSSLVRNTLVDDDLRIARGESPQIGAAIVRANRQQDMPRMLDRIKGASVAAAWWKAHYDGIAWADAYMDLFPGSFSKGSLERVKESLPLEQRQRIASAAKAQREIDDAVAAGRDATPLTAEQAATKLEISKRSKDRIQAALRAARGNNWRETPQVAAKIRAAGC